MQQHPFDPVYDENSSILILGTFPSVKSREYGFFYGHPQNRFWKLITHLTNSSEIPKSILEKKQILIQNKIAIWDVIQICNIKGSSDSSITNVIPMDLKTILNNSKIKNIYTNGEKAFQMYMKYSYAQIGRDITKLPSTSPANATYNFDRLLSEWQKHILF